MLNEVPEGWVASKPLACFVDNIGKKWDGKSKALYVGLEHIAQSEGRLVAIGDTDGIASAKSAFEKCDVLFGKLRPNLRKFWYADTSGVCSTDILVLRAKQGLLPKFLFFLTQSTEFIECAVQDAVGTKMPRTSWKSLGAQCLPIPPLTEQKRIAEVLLSVDESIQATQRLIEQAERVKQGLMEELLTGGLGSEAIERGEVPEGWLSSTFGDEIEFKGGNQPPKKTFIYEPKDGYVRLLQIRDFENDLKPAYIPETATKVRCNEQDILIARYGASLGRICRGKAGAYNVALVKLLLSERLVADYAFYWLNGDTFQSYLISVGSRSAQAGFNKQDLAPLVLLLPPLTEQKRIAEVLSSVDDRVKRHKDELEELSRLKKGLMDDLLTGKVRTV
ncbi:restriction endonuclease subunit S [Idiomarina loihiensis]|uniref:restriction endonuclease subunit S n=1 Tax=Idiomarina loihiensis TaxID=135577 RepID=UPI00384C276C